MFIENKVLGEVKIVHGLRKNAAKKIFSFFYLILIPSTRKDAQTLGGFNSFSRLMKQES